MFVELFLRLVHSLLQVMQSGSTLTHWGIADWALHSEFLTSIFYRILCALYIPKQATFHDKNMGHFPPWKDSCNSHVTLQTNQFLMFVDFLQIFTRKRSLCCDGFGKMCTYVTHKTLVVHLIFTKE